MEIYQQFSDSEEIEERVEWIYTYADMVALLLCFFIMLFAASSPEKDKLKAIAAALRQMPWTTSPFNQEGTDAIMDLNSLSSQIVNENITSSEKIVTLDRNSLKIQLSDAVQFDAGSARPQKVSIPKIRKLAGILYRYGGKIIIEGHADNTPIGKHKFSSNWALSSARAASVAELLIGQGLLDDRIKVVGYGSTRPLISNDGTENIAENRRVDILVKRR